MAAKRHAQGLKLPSDINKKTVNDEELVSPFDHSSASKMNQFYLELILDAELIL